MIKDKIIKRLKSLLTPLALPAVIYAESLIGSGFGETKKQIAIDFILQKLPVVFMPFKSLIKNIFYELFDFALEAAVKKLHSIQSSLGGGENK